MRWAGGCLGNLSANGTVSQYNGNIAAMQWRTNLSACNARNQYRFTYDAANRLKTADHYTNSGAGWTFTNNYTESNLTYDLNGNIKSYNRRGVLTGGAIGQIDLLSYTYGDALRPDKLTQMADGGDGLKGFKRTNSLTGDHYLYDLNGNMTQDKHKGFVFAYNYLNLPTTMTKGASVITMTYTADGEKLTKAVTGGGATKNYVSGIEYSGANVEAIYHAEGRLTPNGTDFHYEYTLKDHLGNARVSFRAVTNGTAIQHLQENHYYPFGMEMEGAWQVQVGVENQYQYNGKELNEDFGLNWYDYGFRWYDASIGRFPCIDPIASDYAHVTPYNYAENEPVGSIDLWGLQRLKISSLGGPFFYRTSAASGWIQKSATLGAAMKHPIAAAKVGEFKSGSTNISSVSSRISRHVALDGNNLSTGIGSERNALRHTLWSATINQEFGASIAETLTNAHDGIGFAETAFVDMDSPFEGDMSLADDVVDFLNNKIGRSITSEGGDLSTLEIAMDALDVFKDAGLYTASIDNDGNVTIHRTKITQKQYDTAMGILHQLTNGGFSAKEQKERDK